MEVLEGERSRERGPDRGIEGRVGEIRGCPGVVSGSRVDMMGWAVVGIVAKDDAGWWVGCLMEVAMQVVARV